MGCCSSQPDVAVPQSSAAASSYVPPLPVTNLNDVSKSSALAPYLVPASQPNPTVPSLSGPPRLYPTVPTAGSPVQAPVAQHPLPQASAAASLPTVDVARQLFPVAPAASTASAVPHSNVARPDPSIALTEAELLRISPGVLRDLGRQRLGWKNARAETEEGHAANVKRALKEPLGSRLRWGDLTPEVTDALLQGATVPPAASAAAAAAHTQVSMPGLSAAAAVPRAVDSSARAGSGLDVASPVSAGAAPVAATGVATSGRSGGASATGRSGSASAAGRSGSEPAAGSCPLPGLASPAAKPGLPGAAASPAVLSPTGRSSSGIAGSSSGPHATAAFSPAYDSRKHSGVADPDDEEDDDYDHQEEDDGSGVANGDSAAVTSPGGASSRGASGTTGTGSGRGRGAGRGGRGRGGGAVGRGASGEEPSGTGAAGAAAAAAARHPDERPSGGVIGSLLRGPVNGFAAAALCRCGGRDKYTGAQLVMAGEGASARLLAAPAGASAAECAAMGLPPADVMDPRVSVQVDHIVECQCVGRAVHDGAPAHLICDAASLLPSPTGHSPIVQMWRPSDGGVGGVAVAGAGAAVAIAGAGAVAAAGAAGAGSSRLPSLRDAFLAPIQAPLNDVANLNVTTGKVNGPKGQGVRLFLNRYGTRGEMPLAAALLQDGKGGERLIARVVRAIGEGMLESSHDLVPAIAGTGAMRRDVGGHPDAATLSYAAVYRSVGESLQKQLDSMDLDWMRPGADEGGWRDRLRKR